MNAEHDAIDLTFREEWALLTMEVAALGEQLRDTLLPTFVTASVALGNFARVFVDIYLRRYAIERLGLTEVDIRCIEGMTVVQCNGRRYPVAVDDFVGWVNP